MIKRANVDGDVVTYICGFAAQESWYVTPDGLLTFPNKTRAKEEGYEHVVEVVEAEPVSHALKLVKNLLLRVMEQTGAEEVVVYLSGTGNYREDVATIKPYKGNRPDRKPIHYDKIREYLVEVCNAIIVDGMEADDTLGINQSEETVICTIDKDLDMIPGYHFNLKSNVLYTVTPEQAIYNFYFQLLVGDPVDNIQGCPGIGKKKAEKILNSVPEFEAEEFYWATLCAYEKAVPRPMDNLIENARLLWIQRTDGEMWEPPE